MKTTCVAPSTVTEVARALSAAFSAGDGPRVHELYGDDMRRGFTVEKTSAFVRGVFEDAGPWQSVERTAGQTDPCRGSFRVHAARMDFSLDLVVASDGRIRGYELRPVPPPPPPIARSEIPLALPFRGEWTVLWGGDRLDVNHHAETQSQRRAADLFVTDASGRSYRTDGKTNADYFAFGKPILAVADGAVVTAVDGVPENVPGKATLSFVPGNVVILQHGATLFSVYAHLQTGSVSVKAGASVKRGDALGLCGNSGHSTEPHLHFQLQDGPSFDDSWGVEGVFSGVALRRGERKTTEAHYAFLKGDRIAPATP